MTDNILVNLPNKDRPGKLKNNFRILSLLLAFASGAFFCQAQPPQAMITGVIVDAITGNGVEGALVSLKGKGKSTTTDAGGNFELLVDAGRYLCEVSHVSYKPQSEEILAISGKTLTVNFRLDESATQLDEVTVQSRLPGAGDPAAISLPIEKVLRMPANFFDPVRMLTSYAGIVGTNDQANNIVVKGNSPNGLQWKLNGMDIVNPNHLANAGTFSDRPTANGGGVNILSAQMLDRTSFYSGHIPSRYGNFTSGVFDMSLRDGNRQEKEYTAQASLIGLDFSAEGPASNRTSYLANYRYSTVGLLSQLGVNFGDEQISFQDLSFNLSTALKSGKLSFFGLGGLSRNRFESKDTADWKVNKDRYDIDYESTMYGVGIRYDRSKSANRSFWMGTTLSGNNQRRDMHADAVRTFPAEDEPLETNTTLLSTTAAWRVRLSPAFTGEIGAVVNLYKQYFGIEPLTPRESSDVLSQPYAELTFARRKWSISGGVHGYYSTLSKRQGVDYRSKVEFALSPTSAIYLAGGQVSQHMQSSVYFAASQSMTLMPKRYAELGVSKRIAEWTVNSSVYYQYYWRVPPLSSTSVLNYTDGFVFVPALGSGSVGFNKGITLQAERSFLSDFYVLAAGSLYDSKSVINNVKQDTRFNGRYSLQFTTGYERGRDTEGKRKAFGIHLRTFYQGGLRESSIDITQSRSQRTTVVPVYNYGLQLKDYFRTDLRVSWRKDKVGYTRTISIDVQNVTSAKNEAFHYFDPVTDQIETQYQVGIIPVLVYRIDF